MKAKKILGHTIVVGRRRGVVAAPCGGGERKVGLGEHGDKACGNNQSICYLCKMATKKQSRSDNAEICALHKEWDEALCPICMDHPHNAILLLCSSHAKGCRSYICDTSYRHSNCLDRFRKLAIDSSSSPSLTRLVTTTGQNSTNVSLPISGVPINNETVGVNDSGENGVPLVVVPERATESLSLKCPMCRGDVLGWNVLEEARKYLDVKRRSCSQESCSFVGNYWELRKHARSVHPLARPGEIDPSRQRSWRRLEHRREFDDIVSSIRSAMPGAIVLGDYIIETGGDGFAAEREMSSGDIDEPWWTTFFLFQMLRSMEREPITRSRAWTRHRRSGRSSSGRRYLWGENLFGQEDDGNDDDDDLIDGHNDMTILSDMGENDDSPIPRRRRRVTRSTSSGNDT
ncbi:hypothetical protein Nepgr_022260 [Nepenthes gracilis]|uniref:Uncharacterized protein n=1 Tax=Nepenthes gracilis TaxID=150966 RepID=A0AAD3T0J8_NEPGR|nr:hypothetical protein Nepgr_022260 [Nepenthes gracilis]